MSGLTADAQEVEAKTASPPPEGDVSNGTSHSASRARLREFRTQFLILTRNRLNAVALAFIAAFVVIAVTAPYIAPYPESITGTTNLDIKMQAPSLSHPFGTDGFGRDIFSRVLYGTRMLTHRVRDFRESGAAHRRPLGHTGGGRWRVCR